MKFSKMLFELVIAGMLGAGGNCAETIASNKVWGGKGINETPETVQFGSVIPVDGKGHPCAIKINSDSNIPDANANCADAEMKWNGRIEGLRTQQVTLNGTLTPENLKDGGYISHVEGTVETASDKGQMTNKWKFDAQLETFKPIVEIVQNGTAQYIFANATAFVPVQFKVTTNSVNNKQTDIEIGIVDVSFEADDGSGKLFNFTAEDCKFDIGDGCGNDTLSNESHGLYTAWVPIEKFNVKLSCRTVSNRAKFTVVLHNVKIASKFEFASLESKKSTIKLFGDSTIDVVEMGEPLKPFPFFEKNQSTYSEMAKYTYLSGSDSADKSWKEVGEPRDGWEGAKQGVAFTNDASPLQQQKTWLLTAGVELLPDMRNGNYYGRLWDQVINRSCGQRLGACVAISYGRRQVKVLSGIGDGKGMNIKNDQTMLDAIMPMGDLQMSIDGVSGNAPGISIDWTQGITSLLSLPAAFFSGPVLGTLGVAAALLGAADSITVVGDTGALLSCYATCEIRDRDNPTAQSNFLDIVSPIIVYRNDNRPGPSYRWNSRNVAKVGEIFIFALTFNAEVAAKKSIWYQYNVDATARFDFAADSECCAKLRCY